MKRTNTERNRKGPWNALRPIAACIDWITCTATADGLGPQLWAIGERFLRDDDAVDDRALPWQMKGYRGWHSSHVRLGSRPSGCLLSLSGQQSSNKWRDAFMAAENCSRLDLAVDVTCDPPMAMLARHIYAKMIHGPLRNGRPSSSRLIVGSDGGSTAYIGSRQSEFFGRVYDKGIEQKTHSRGQWWRWELEVKGDAAKRVAHTIISSEDEGMAIGSINADWFRSRLGDCYPFSGKLAVRNREQSSTSTDRKLQWLSRQVRPTVIELLGRLESARILEALGFPQSAVAVS